MVDPEPATPFYGASDNGRVFEPRRAPISVADLLHRHTAGLQFVVHQNMCAPMRFHCFSQEIQCCLPIPALRDKALEGFYLVIHRPQNIVCLAVNLHKHFVHVPFPI